MVRKHFVCYINLIFQDTVGSSVCPYGFNEETAVVAYHQPSTYNSFGKGTSWSNTSWKETCCRSPGSNPWCLNFIIHHHPPFWGGPRVNGLTPKRTNGLASQNVWCLARCLPHSRRWKWFPQQGHLPQKSLTPKITKDSKPTSWNLLAEIF